MQGLRGPPHLLEIAQARRGSSKFWPRTTTLAVLVGCLGAGAWGIVEILVAEFWARTTTLAVKLGVCGAGAWGVANDNPLGVPGVS